ncbi:hypothetical protein S83_003960, partial [Arachis hypogaea]
PSEPALPVLPRQSPLAASPFYLVAAAGLPREQRRRIVFEFESVPTLRRTKVARCNKCNHGEAVFFQ